MAIFNRKFKAGLIIALATTAFIGCSDNNPDPHEASRQKEEKRVSLKAKLANDIQNLSYPEYDRKASYLFMTTFIDILATEITPETPYRKLFELHTRFVVTGICATMNIASDSLKKERINELRSLIPVSAIVNSDVEEFGRISSNFDRIEPTEKECQAIVSDVQEV